MRFGREGERRGERKVDTRLFPLDLRAMPLSGSHNRTCLHEIVLSPSLLNYLTCLKKLGTTSQASFKVSNACMWMWAESHNVTLFYSLLHCYGGPALFYLTFYFMNVMGNFKLHLNISHFFVFSPSILT